jgi:hypothetical protein
MPAKAVAFSGSIGCLRLISISVSSLLLTLLCDFERDCDLANQRERYFGVIITPSLHIISRSITL